MSSLNGALVLCQESRVVAMCTVPLFHVYGFFYCVRCLAFGESLVVFSKFNFQLMMKSIQQFSVGDYDLRSLQVVLSGGAPLSIPLMKRFNTLFPNVALVQVILVLIVHILLLGL